MLTEDEIACLLEPYVDAVRARVAVGSAGMALVDWPDIYRQLAVYLELLLKWNERMNLTAIREPKEMVRRHFGESLFAGAYLDSHGWSCETLLDYGSGAGFPGVPIQILRPDVLVTLAESQGKKAGFLREAVRTLGLRSEVWHGRVEDMPVERQFEVVAMRAVDKMAVAVEEGARRAEGRLLILAVAGMGESSGLKDSFDEVRTIPVPGSDSSVLWVAQR